MQFKDYLATFPAIEHLSGLSVLDGSEIIHHIPAVEGKLGSLRLYHALALQFDHQLNAESAKQGLMWFAEHVEDAKQNPNKHPNIDLLLKVVANNSRYLLKPESK